MFSFWHVLVFCSLSILLIAYLFLIWNFNYWKNRNVNGPTPLPLLGSFPNAILQKRNFIYDINDIYLKYKKTESFVGVFSNRLPQLLILEPALAHEILVTKFKHFHDNESAKLASKKHDPLLAFNPFFLTGNEWKEKRSEIIPGLSINKIKSCYPLMQQISKKMLKYIDEQGTKDSKHGVDVKDVAFRLTTEIVSDFVLGIEASCFDTKRQSSFLHLAQNLFENSTWFVLYRTIVAIFPKLILIYPLRFFSKKIQVFFVNLIKKAVDIRKEQKIDRIDFLNYLIQLQEKKGLQPLAMASHIMTFILDGFETSSAAITFLLLFIARNPEIQNRLRLEIEDNVDDEGNVSFEKLHELQYLDMCFNEALRILPPVILLRKTCTIPCELQNKNGSVIKLNVNDRIVIPVYSFHNDEDLFPMADKFSPDRFSEENGGIKKFKDSGMFLPFGDGPRICLGMRFGTTVTKAAVLNIIRNYNVIVNPHTRKDNLLHPKSFAPTVEGGVWIDFEPIIQNKT